ncbi:unnamed protein product, partial [Brachionus calyciflorus]
VENYLVAFNLTSRNIIFSQLWNTEIKYMEMLNNTFIILQHSLREICTIKINSNGLSNIKKKSFSNDLTIRVIRPLNETLVMFSSNRFIGIWDLEKDQIFIQKVVENEILSLEIFNFELILIGDNLGKIYQLNMTDLSKIAVLWEQSETFYYSVQIEINITNATSLNEIEQSNCIESFSQDISIVDDSSYSGLNQNFSQNTGFEVEFSFIDSNLNTVIDIIQSNLDINDCLGNCSGNGFCKIKEFKYTCECFSNYAGTNCQLNTLPCASNPCLNNGTCINDLINKNFSCECLKNENQTSLFYGSFCENKVNICENETCSKNGVCYDINDEAKCKCFKSYTGEKCENETTEIKVIKSVIKTSVIIAIINNDLCCLDSN